MNIDRKYIVWALAYAIAGMALGIYMAASQNHGQHVTHAHILLLGFVSSAIYGFIYKLWLAGTVSILAQLQLYVHQGGVLALCGGLYLLYGGGGHMALLEPVMGLASIAVLLGALTMLFLFVKSRHSAF